MDFRIFYKLRKLMLEIIEESSDFYLTEALKIKLKKTSNTIPPQELLEFEKWEKMMNRKITLIGNFNYENENFKIYKSGHVDAYRYSKSLIGSMTFKIAKETPEIKIRGEGISNEFMISIVEKTMRKFSLEPFENFRKIMIVYKNKEHKYNYILCSSIKGTNKIQIGSIMQGEREHPDYALKHEADKKLIFESIGVCLLHIDI